MLKPSALATLSDSPWAHLGRRRAAARKEWYASAQAPLEIDKVLIDEKFGSDVAFGSQQ
jgi:hypothetical protein